jgi:hypothetical protein
MMLPFDVRENIMHTIHVCCIAAAHDVIQASNLFSRVVQVWNMDVDVAIQQHSVHIKISGT